MQNNIRIRNRAKQCTIDIEGTIGIPEEWQFEDPAQRVATYDAFRNAVRCIGGIEAAEIVVNIRSTGGDVNDALLIYEALTGLSARITTRCYGYTASAATLIAQAASEGRREISANALYLIHNAVCATEGNAEELEARLDLLHQTDQRLAALYAARSGKSEADFAALMSENNGCGRWLSPAEAVAAGLADSIIGQTVHRESAGTASRTETSERPVVEPTRWNRAEPSHTLSAARPILPGFLRRWKLKVHTASAPPDPADDRNILHFDDDPALRPIQSITAAREGQENVQPTATLPREDPSVHDAMRTPNEQAYTDDAKRFAKF